MESERDCAKVEAARLNRARSASRYFRFPIADCQLRGHGVAQLGRGAETIDAAGPGNWQSAIGNRKGHPFCPV
jgi:hypothetical protein